MMPGRLIPVENVTLLLADGCPNAAAGCKCVHYQVAMFLCIIRVVMGRN